MILRFLYTINVLLLLCTMILFVLKYRKFKANMILSSVTWFTLYYFFYFMIPVCFLPTVLKKPDLFGSYFFSDTTLILTYLICFAESCIIVTLFYLFRPLENNSLDVKNRNKIISMLCDIILWYFALSSCIGLFAIINKIRQVGYLKAFFELEEVGEKYRVLFKFSTLRYLAVVCCYYKLCKTKKFSNLGLLVPNLVFELLAGKRTTAFLYVLFIYLLIVRLKKKTYIKIMIPIFVGLLVSVLFSRMSSLTQDSLNFDIMIASALAEFINTFLTLPYVIEHNMFGVISIDQVLYNLYGAILPGSIRMNILTSMNYQEVGHILALTIAKGFGLGSNVISYNICTFGYIGLFVLPLSFILVISIEKKIVFRL